MDDQEFLDAAALAALPVVLSHEYGDTFKEVAPRCYRIAAALAAERKDRIPPGVDALVPATAALGDPSFTLHVQGSGFKPTSQILWNGSPEPTVFVSEFELTTGVNMDTAHHAVDIPVAVLNGNVASNPLTFELTEAATRKRGADR